MKSLFALILGLAFTFSVASPVAFASELSVKNTTSVYHGEKGGKKKKDCCQQKSEKDCCKSKASATKEAGAEKAGCSTDKAATKAGGCCAGKKTTEAAK